MGYIGNVPAEKYTALTQQTFSSPTGTSFTLDQACTNSKDIALFIDNVRQNPASYSVSGTSLTTSTISSPSTMYCLFNGRTTETVNPPDDSVGTAKVSDNAITLAKMAGGTDGQIITYDASGDPVAVGPGTDGQVLTSTGAGSPPAFEDAGGGAWTLIGTAVASTSASLTITGLNSTYDTYAIALSDMHPVNDGAALWLRLGDSGGIDTSGYSTHVSDVKEGSSSYVGVEAAATGRISLNFGTDNAAGEGCGALLYLHTPSDAVTRPMISGTTTAIDGSSTVRGGFLIGQRTAVITVDRVQVLFSGGDIVSGRMTVWGIAHA